MMFVKESLICLCYLLTPGQKGHERQEGRRIAETHQSTV